jgi:hypothetical protein
VTFVIAEGEVAEGLVVRLRAGCTPGGHIVAIGTGLRVTGKGPMEPERYVLGPVDFVADVRIVARDVRITVVVVGRLGSGPPGLESI